MTAMEEWRWPPAYDEKYRPAQTQQYWFPHRETMSPGERDDQILKRIRDVMRYAHSRSPFYRARWDQAGVRPDDIRSLEDFERVPVVTKADLQASQTVAPPFGDYLCVDRSEVRHIHGTSGTTGNPTAFGINEPDWRAIANAHARVMWGIGIRPHDIVMVGSFFSLYMGSWGALIGAERLGATVLPFGAGVPGQTVRAIRWINHMKPTVFYGTPSYALHVAEVAHSEGHDPSEWGIRFLVFSGEPGAAIPSIRARIEREYGGLVFDTGSMAEMSPWMNLGESSGRAGMLCWQDIVYTEVVDPKRHTRVSFGMEGSPVYTHLERTSQPMIRMLSGDLTRWDEGPSPCGRTYPILPRGIYGRIDDMFIVRGVNIYPSAIEDVLGELADYGGEHRIIISRGLAMDDLVVQVEYARDLVGAEQVARFKEHAQHALSAQIGISARVVTVPPGTLERVEFKARRVIDDRDLFREFRGSGAAFETL